MKMKSLLAVTAVGWLVLLSAGLIPAQASANNSQNAGATATLCVLVQGAVRSPGRLELERPVRLGEAIKMAGGANDNAFEMVQIVHAPGFKCGQPEGHVMDCVDCRPTVSPLPVLYFYNVSGLNSEDEKANPYLEQGDIVMVHKVAPVYVTGAVVAPQALELKPKLTLTQAIETAGGMLRDSNAKKVRIIRGQPGDSTGESLLVDLNAIRKHRAEDIILKPFDIIDVPPKRGRRGVL